jgi:hypothetical protein
MNPHALNILNPNVIEQKRISVKNEPLYSLRDFKSVPKRVIYIDNEHIVSKVKVRANIFLDSYLLENL